GAVILKDKGLPAWLGWTAFPVALIAAAPATALVGMASPVDVVIATSGLLLWVAAVAGILAWRGLAPALQRGQD
ncbi:hypothetical protein, partial [Phenylobacterium sp.]|uniref:hypothetical protein n=1 Tax=Phenylobacterium sp. TaxID=1871053 RepID=UPI0037C977D1